MQPAPPRLKGRKPAPAPPTLAPSGGAFTIKGPPDSARQDSGMPCSSSLPLFRCSALLLCAALAKPARAEAPPVELNRDVRPILADACFQCHGPDRARRTAGLRL